MSTSSFLWRKAMATNSLFVCICVYKKRKQFVRKKLLFSQDKRNEKQFYSHHSTIALQYFLLFISSKKGVSLSHVSPHTVLLHSLF